MKRFLSLIIFIAALWFVINITTSILNNKGVKVEIKQKENKVTQKISSNRVNNMLSDIFNIYLNEERYRVKIDYTINTLEDETSNIELKMYFDGKEVLKKVVVPNLDSTIEDPFKDETIVEKVLFTENNFKIVNSDKDYLFVLIGYMDNYGEYYLFNNKGNLLLDKPLIGYDNRAQYVNEEDADLEIFYEDRVGSRLKVNEGEVYFLELEDKKGLSFKEYKYNINNNKVDRELVNTYENIKVKEATE